MYVFQQSYIRILYSSYSLLSFMIHFLGLGWWREVQWKERRQPRILLLNKNLLVGWWLIKKYTWFILLYSDHEVSDNEISSHRHLYVGFHIPSKKKGHTPHHRKSSVTGNGQANKNHVRNKHLKLPKEELRPGKIENKCFDWSL